MTTAQASGVERRAPADRKRGLVLAGGGLKAAYAGGVLEQLLLALRDDDAHPAFRHVEASSSGVFNAAMMAAGKNPGEIGDAWRRFRPLRSISLNWLQLWKLSWGESIFTWKRFMKRVAKSPRRGGWGLTLAATGAKPKRATQYSFNAYNFTRHSLVHFTPETLDERRFQACIALPRWFPPVRLESDIGKKREEDVFVDAVFATDSNAAALLEHDLDEIWVIWTVDVRGAFRNGWVSNYFRLLEQAAAAAYRREREQILRTFESAHELPDGAPSANTKILYEISGDVPLHYLFGFTRGAVRRAVKQGGDDASAYLAQYQHLWAEP